MFLTNITIVLLQDYKDTNVVLCRCHSFTTTNYYDFSWKCYIYK